MPFQLPETLPDTVSELDELRSQAEREIRVYQTRAEAGHEITVEEATDFERLLDAVGTIDTARDEAAQAEAAHADQISGLLTRAQAATAAQEADADADAQEGGEAPDAGAADANVSEGDAGDEQADEAPQAIAASGDRRPVNFGHTGNQDAPTNEGPGWQMHPDAPRYRPGRVGFTELGQALDTVRPGSRSAMRPNRSNKQLGNVSFARQVVATLGRDMPTVGDDHALVAAIEAATSSIPGHDGAVTANALTAAGGWCAPSEQLYDFCDVPDANDLISVPEIAINRGGIRWPVEPDLSAIFESFQFFFTETELEAEDAGGNPTAIKNCVEIPCPDEFDEIRLNAVGYCVEAGILQTQGWPELITWFMQHLAQEHLRAISRRTIMDIESGSGTLKVIPPASVLGAVPSVLNSLALMAYNIRVSRGLPRNAPIEGIAPSWFMEVLRADLTMRSDDDLGWFDVTDAQIQGWLNSRGIALQFVGDWQTRDAGKPGNLNTLQWPSYVDVILYPAGTWFRSMSPVIELGVMYPKELLQVNRYTRFFTEDAIAVGKRCWTSIITRIPLAPSGAIGPRIDVSPAYVQPTGAAATTADTTGGTPPAQAGTP